MEHKGRAPAGDFRPLLGGRSERTLAAVVGVCVLLTVTDLVASFVAPNEGFSEGNTMPMGLSGFLKLDVIDSLPLTKAIFIVGISALALIGPMSAERTPRR